MNNNVWAVIPAREGSKGVVNKNLKNFNGDPLIGRCINRINDSKSFEKIIVTSDGADILKIAEDYGSEIYLRTNNNDSNDSVMTDAPMLSFLKTLSADKLPEFVFMIQCTAPFIEPKTYRDAVSLLKQNPDSTVFAAQDAHQFLWKENKENKVHGWKPINHPFDKRVGRQFIEDIQVHETGAFYGFRTKNFIESGFRFFNTAYPVLISKTESIDINDDDDWNFAEYVAQQEDRK